jgi:hypothetical protein
VKLRKIKGGALCRFFFVSYCIISGSGVAVIGSCLRRGGILGRLLLLLLPLLLLHFLLLRSQGAQLEGVDATFAGHFLVEEGIDHAVAGGLHLGLEGIRDDDQSEMSLAGGAALHCLVVGMKVGVVVNLQGSRVESRGDLGSNGIFYRRVGTHGGDLPTYG